jgi:hypothetical protein
MSPRIPLLLIGVVSLHTLQAQISGPVNAPAFPAATPPPSIYPLTENEARNIARAQFPNGKVLKSKLTSEGVKSVWAVGVEVDELKGYRYLRTHRDYSVVMIDAQSQKVLSVKHHVSRKAAD